MTDREAILADHFGCIASIIKFYYPTLLFTMSNRITSETEGIFPLNGAFRCFMVGTSTFIAYEAVMCMVLGAHTYQALQ